MVAARAWGRLHCNPQTVETLHSEDDVTRALARGPGLPRGMGRSYGDACLNPGGKLWSTLGLDQLIVFDRERGLLHCEAGVLLRDIQALAVASGWMLPVTPGTQYVTVGGAIANDVHGKNHHRQGSFGDHVVSLRLLRSDGRQVHCGPDVEEAWFRATVGGLGLTGVITEATVQLRPVAGPLLDTETLPFHTLAEFYRLATESEPDWEYTVAWVDCVGRRERRGIFMRANHSAETGTLPPPGRGFQLPFTPPISLVNRLTLRPFTAAYFHWQRWKCGPGRSHYQPFFYPLDAIREWNRMYGPRGFYQYQCVVPTNGAADAIEALLAETSKANSGSFLVVLKTFGERESAGMLSFPRAGTTLALDFPNRGAATLDLFHRLDAIVAAAGGRLYAAKDARMPREMFESAYPALAEFLQYRDPGISSGLSRRLLGR